MPLPVLWSITNVLDGADVAAQAGDLGGGGVSYVELLILYEPWAGERLVLEKALPWCWRGETANFSVGCSSWSRH